MLKIPYIRLSQGELNGGFPVSAVFGALPPRRIACLNWPAEYPYAPAVSFKVFHSGAVLYLEYSVSEKYTRALETLDGNYVYKDSCVEFFIALGDERCYYNFEWNAAGVTYMAYRPGREGAEPAPAGVLAMVRTQSSLGAAPIEEFSAGIGDNQWSLKIAIPVEAFWHSGIGSFSGLKARANLFKCGDGLKVPHYLSYAPIDTPSPDYHRPEFFIPAEFE